MGGRTDRNGGDCNADSFVNGCTVLALVESGRMSDERIAQTVEVSLLVMARTTLPAKQTVCND